MVHFAFIHESQSALDSGMQILRGETPVVWGGGGAFPAPLSLIAETLVSVSTPLN